ncbi:hypothetical protein [Sphingobacterium corticibacter]|uniref:Uncharacterized protein n=1 Tax=Sphingobacterium corticibacter TaxID=2171749 RepID=A0A2T8HLK0_9SPHI|nr:hypothetical protein [Sphingobacterium corticibacter]PVH26307.1 hypothetical protein DC487_01380 [Sphingobacterium corticibacter]
MKKSLQVTHEVSESDNTNTDYKQKGYLALPFDESQFAEFVKGLLGTPQTITKNLFGEFDLDLSELQNIHYLINQRVRQQNGGKFLQLKSQIYFNDDSSIILSSFEELSTYNEVKKVVSIAIRMTWSYLIQFPDKDVPERQEIEILFVCNFNEYEGRDNLIALMSPRRNIASIHIRIEHTARTWGADMETLLTNYLQGLFRKENSFRRFMRSNALLCSAFVTMFWGMITTYLWSDRSSKILEKRKAEIDDFLKSNDSLNDKLNYLISSVLDYKSTQFNNDKFVFSLVMGLCIIISMTSIIALLRSRKKSFLLLSKESYKFKIDTENDYRGAITLYIVGIVVSIGVNIVSAFILTYFMSVD